MEATLSHSKATPVPGKQRQTANWRKTLVPWLFLLPLLLINIIVVLGPSVGSIFYAFTEWSGVGPAKFVGLANFQRMLGDRVFRLAFVNNVKWTVLFLTVPIFMGLLGAALLSQIKRYQLLFRIAYFIPYVLASVVTAGEFIREWSTADLAARLRFQSSPQQLQVSWSFGRLERAHSLEGPWQPMPSAISPWNVSLTEIAEFFRVVAEPEE